jgi:hypothetical protein
LPVSLMVTTACHYHRRRTARSHLEHLSVIQIAIAGIYACPSADLLWDIRKLCVSVESSGTALVFEIRRVKLRRWLDRVVIAHRPVVCDVALRLGAGDPKGRREYKPWFDDPLSVHGLAFCANARLLVLRMREMRSPMAGARC